MTRLKSSERLSNRLNREWTAYVGDDDDVERTKLPRDPKRVLQWAKATFHLTPDLL
jgi:hypothetical protein